MIKPEDRDTVAEIIRRLEAAEKILISSHAGPDGDSVGSAIGLMLALKRRGKTVRYVNADEPPADLSFLSGFTELKISHRDVEAYDMGVVLDTAYLERLGEAWKHILPIKNRVVIDHHETPGGSNAADVAWIDSGAASVTLMIAALLDEMKIELDREIAVALYTGLFTDTGSFCQSNTSPEAMRYGARFIEAGVVPFDVNKQVFENRRVEAVRLCGLACMRAVIEDGIAHSYITQADYREFGADEEDTEGIAHALREIGPARVIVFLREVSEGRIKVTFRAKDRVDVAAVARHFGGGGHAAAAGCTIHGSLETARANVLDHLKTILKNGVN